MNTQKLLVGFGAGLLGLGACAQTRAYTPPGAGSPASLESHVAAYTPPANPLATPLEPINGKNDSGSMHNMPGMKGMDGMKHDDPSPSGLTVYTCPMHADVRSDRPGNCPKCGMTLVPKKATASETHQDEGTP